MIYKALSVDCDLSPELQTAIDALLYHVNYADGHLEDCYRSELDVILKADLRAGEITREMFDKLRDYYVSGEIYAESGHPRDLSEKIKYSVLYDDDGRISDKYSREIEELYAEIEKNYLSVLYMDVNASNAEYMVVEIEQNIQTRFAVPEIELEAREQEMFDTYLERWKYITTIFVYDVAHNYLTPDGVEAKSKQIRNAFFFYARKNSDMLNLFAKYLDEILQTLDISDDISKYIYELLLTGEDCYK